jgi:TonB family protein
LNTMRTEADEIGLTPIITLVVWVGCVVAGVLGTNDPLKKTPAPPAKKPVVDVQLIDVAISSSPIVRSDKTANAVGAPDVPAAPQLPAAPPSVAAPDVPAAPPLSDVSPPPTLVGLLSKPNEFSKASSQPAATATTTTTTTPTTPVSARPDAPRTAASGIQHLVYGQGAAVQPAPEYPLECVLAHEEGTVVIQFHIDDLGQIGDVRVTTPSRWPLLNQAAARSVRQTWSFPPGLPGAPGYFDVSIEYKLAPPS